MYRQALAADEPPRPKTSNEQRVRRPRSDRCPQAGKQLFFGSESRDSTPDLVFGGVTVVTGVLGSVAGGVALDRMGRWGARCEEEVY